jgi:hypothetical protein
MGERSAPAVQTAFWQVIPETRFMEGRQFAALIGHNRQHTDATFSLDMRAASPLAPRGLMIATCYS